MQATLYAISGKSAIIIVPELCEAYVIDTIRLPTTRVGSVFVMDRQMLVQATPYGIDLSIVFPDGISIDPKELQCRLLSAGIVSLEDLKGKPSAINQALLSMIGAISASVYRTIKTIMEEQ